jgi:hypothetical protein
MLLKKMSTWNVLQLIDNERARQDELWGPADSGVFDSRPDGTEPGYEDALLWARESYEIARSSGKMTWRHILAEEFYEVCSETNPDKLKEELVQLAAVCVEWIEVIDRRRGK